MYAKIAQESISRSYEHEAANLSIISWIRFLFVLVYPSANITELKALL